MVHTGEECSTRIVEIVCAAEVEGAVCDSAYSYELDVVDDRTGLGPLAYYVWYDSTRSHGRWGCGRSARTVNRAGGVISDAFVCKPS